MRQKLTYCGAEVYTHDHDHFYLSLVIPAKAREAFFTLYALNLELSRIPGLVSEEMIGHIRYAWWTEALEEMAATGNTKGHPVLQGILEAKLLPELALMVIAHYREHYPDHVSDSDHLVDPAALKLVQTLCPEVENAWQKTKALIDRHRARHGAKLTPWLLAKILIYNI